MTKRTCLTNNLNKPTVQAAALSLALALTLTTALSAAEKTIERSTLPAAVEKTLAANLNGATLKDITTEREHGVQTYEAETILDGHTRDMEITADGKLTEIEEEVALDSLSPAVQSALTTRAAGAKITKVESLTKQGKIVAYEAATLNGTHSGEIQVGPMGEKLAHEE